MIRPLTHKSGGFTVVEVLVYLAIFFTVSTASTVFLLSLQEFVNQYRVETVLYRSGTNVMEQLLLNLRQSDQVDVLNSTFETLESGRITLEQGGSNTSISLNGGLLTLSVDGQDLGSMLTDNVLVDSFTVYHYPQADGEFVRVRLSLTATIGSVTKQIILYGGSVVRGSM